MFELTPSQRAAVELQSGAGAALISAAAGAGKTRVLVERLMSHLTADPPHDIDEFLLITYTRAAAGEMRERILKALREHLRHDPPRLMKQTALAHTAWICTLHSYCLEIYKEHHAAAGLPPELRMGDETELELLRTHALDTILDELFEQPEDAGFAALTAMGVTRRGDRRLGDLIRSVWDKTRVYADAHWDTRCLDIAHREVWEPALLRSAHTRLTQWEQRLRVLCARLREDSGAEDAKRLQRMEALETQVRELCDAALAGWEPLRAVLAELKLPTAKQKRDQDDIEAWVQLLRKRLEALQECFYATAEDGEEDAQAVLPAAKALLGAARRFDERYRAEKESRKLMDYHDLERYALAILTDKQGGPSAAARKLSGRFTEILVDEYQDINPAQERIVSLLSRDGRNVFYVGDARQSIYRFQYAEPKLFMEKYERFTLYPERRDGEGVKITLPDNFRSRPEILEAVNHVCSRLMAPGSGEIVYEPLRGGGQREPGKTAGVEWLVTDVSGGGEDEEISVPEAEARTIARRLRELIDAGEATPEDCVILLRSPRTRAKTYRAALTEQGIDSRERADSADWLRSPELLSLVAMLSAADNPLQDIPLIAMLRAPGYGFTSEELALLRAEGPRDGSVYDCLRASSREKSKKVLADLSEWRVLASEWPVWRLAARMASRGELERLTGGEAERRLDAFIELARSAPEGLSLPGFLRWLNALREGRPPVSPASGGRGAVRIMSIHASKGLEFPVVVLASLHSSFNLRDASETALAHGSGLALLRHEAWAEYPTPPYRLIAEQMVWQQKAEEQRLLYVAMTRAERMLIFSHAEKYPDPWRQRFMAGWDSTVWEGLAQEGDSYADWLTWSGDPQRWQIRIEKAGPAPEISIPDALSPDTIPQQDTFCYAHEKSVLLPSKMTFGEWKGRRLDLEVREDAAAEPVPLGTPYASPRFGIRDTIALTAAERGSAAHWVLRWADLSRCVTPEGARAELERVSQALTQAQRDSLSPALLHKLAVSPLGERMRRANKLYRECKFSYLEDSQLLLGEAGEPGESILLQGVIDCFFEDSGTWVVVDYKTDARPNPTEHWPQIAFYERAVSRMTGGGKTEGILYYLKTHEAIRYSDSEPHRA